MKKLVVAGFYRQAKEYAQEKGWQPSEWAYVDSREKMMGRQRGTELHFTGEFWLNPHERDLLQEAKCREFKVIGHPTGEDA